MGFSRNEHFDARHSPIPYLIQLYLILDIEYCLHNHKTNNISYLTRLNNEMTTDDNNNNNNDQNDDVKPIH